VHGWIFLFIFKPPVGNGRGAKRGEVSYAGSFFPLVVELVKIIFY